MYMHHIHHLLLPLKLHMLLYGQKMGYASYEKVMLLQTNVSNSLNYVLQSVFKY